MSVNKDSDHGVTTAENKITRNTPKWHLIYYVLAGFDLLAIGFSLFINHQITELYVASVEVNKEWAGRLSQFSRLSALATEVNRPGNDVFLTLNVADESEKFQLAKIKFNKHLSNIRISNNLLERELGDSLNVHLLEIEGHLQKLNASANMILTLFTSNPEQAGYEMARMDRSFFSLVAVIDIMNREIRAIQASNLAAQSEYAQSLGKYEKGIAVFIFTMVLLVAFYGHFLSKNVAKFMADREEANARYKELNETLEQRVASRTAELEYTNADLERFTYTVSHDLKSPLITISGFIGLLEKDIADANMDKIDTDFKRIKDAAATMRDLLDDLLNLSRIGRGESLRVDVSLNAIVSSVLEMLDVKLNDTQAVITVDSDLPVIHVEAARFKEVYLNLIENALKYRRHDVVPEITIGVSRDQTNRNQTVFFVKDNGMGIDPRYKEKIFGLFESLSNESEGTGVGLAIVKRIVNVHGGRVWVESEGLGFGSTFKFVLTLNDLEQAKTRVEEV